MDVLKCAEGDGVGTVLALVASHPVFSCFSGELMTPTFIGSHLKHYPKHGILYRHNTQAEDCFLICSGRIGLLTEGPWGSPCMLGIKSRGAVVGDLSLFDHSVRTSTAKALEPSLVLVIPYDLLRKSLVENPELSWSVLGAYAARIRANDERLVEALNLDLINRLARRLLDISQGQEQFVLDITQEEIASLVGASRERTNKALITLQRCGAIAIDNHRIYRVLDPDKLVLLALKRRDDRTDAKRLTNHSGPVGSNII